MACRAASLAKILGRIDVEEKIESDAAAAAGVAALREAAVVCGRGRRRSCGPWVGGRGEAAVAGGDKDVAKAVGVNGLDLEDAWVGGARGFVGASHQGDALWRAAVGGQGSGQGRDFACAVHQSRSSAVAGPAAMQAAVAAARRMRSGGEVVGVGVAGSLAGDDANADAEVTPWRAHLTMDSSRLSEVVARYSK